MYGGEGVLEEPRRGRARGFNRPVEGDERGGTAGTLSHSALLRGAGVKPLDQLAVGRRELELPEALRLDPRHRL
jgi:hypothetical protein